MFYFVILFTWVYGWGVLLLLVFDSCLFACVMLNVVVGFYLFWFDNDFVGVWLSYWLVIVNNVVCLYVFMFCVLIIVINYVGLLCICWLRVWWWFWRECCLLCVCWQCLFVLFEFGYLLICLCWLFIFRFWSVCLVMLCCLMLWLVWLELLSLLGTLRGFRWFSWLLLFI